MFVTAADELGKVKELQHIAIDPLDQVFTWPTFQYLLAQRAAKMKQLLMDQKFISGLGNIYSDEVLFAAGLRYDRISRHALLAGGPSPVPGDPGDAAGGDQAPRHHAWTTKPTSTCSASPASTRGSSRSTAGKASRAAAAERRSRRSRSRSGRRTSARSARADGAPPEACRRGSGEPPRRRASARIARSPVTRFAVDRADPVADHDDADSRGPGHRSPSPPRRSRWRARRPRAARRRAPGGAAGASSAPSSPLCGSRTLNAL